MRARSALALAAVAMTAVPTGAVEPGKRPPYWASIAAAKARMRTGPGRTYPASWLYQRADLPVRVVAVFKEWRQVEDPGGTRGWMLANLLSQTRTAFVPDGPVELRERPAADARVAWRAAPGVVGRLSTCVNGWCAPDVQGRKGFVEQGRIWGTDEGEAVP